MPKDTKYWTLKGKTENWKELREYPIPNKQVKQDIPTTPKVVTDSKTEEFMKKEKTPLNEGDLIDELVQTWEKQIKEGEKPPVEDTSVVDMIEQVEEKQDMIEQIKEWTKDEVKEGQEAFAKAKASKEAKKLRDEDVKKEIIAEKIKEKFEPIKTIQEFKARWTNLNNLENFLENKWVTNMERVWNTLIWEENGERVEYIVTKWGYPQKNVVWTVDNEQEQFAKQNGMDFSISNWKVVFNPKTDKDVLDLNMTFWMGNVEYKNPYSDAVVEWNAVTKKFNKYTFWATSDTIYQWLKINEIAVWSKVWSEMLKWNWGQPTKEMLEAQSKYELQVKTDLINKNATELESWISDEKVKVVKSKTDELIEQFKKDQKELIEKYWSIKITTPELDEASKELNEANKALKDLEDSKRKIITNIRKNNPNLPYSTILSMARSETSTINDEIYATQNTVAQKSADFKYEEIKNQARVELEQKKLELQMWLSTSVFNLEANIAEAARLRDLAIEDNDLVRAEEYEYAVKILEKQAELEWKTTSSFWVETKKWLAINDAISINLWDTPKELKHPELTEKYLQDIKDFRWENEELIKKFNQLASGWSNTTSNMEQIMKRQNVIRAIVEWNNPQDVLKSEIRALVLWDKTLKENLTKEIAVIKWMTRIMEIKRNEGTNVVKAITQDVASILWLTIWEDMTSLDQLTTQQIASYLNAISWVAVSPEEAKRIIPIFPQLKDTSWKFNTKAKNMLWVARDNLDTLLDFSLWENDELKEEIFEEFYYPTVRVWAYDNDDANDNISGIE